MKYVFIEEMRKPDLCIVDSLWSIKFIVIYVLLQHNAFLDDSHME